MNQQVKNIYHSHFLTVRSDSPIGNREIFPEKLKSCFSETVQARIRQPLVWIEVECPAEFTSEILDSLKISLNAFPVINRQPVHKTASVHRIAPVIPITTGDREFFLSVDSLTDTHGKQYYDIPLKDAENARYGVYSLSRGGYERYSRREAMAFLYTLTDFIRGEASFFFKNKNDVNTVLRKIEEEVRRLINHLEKALSEVREQYEMENYILLEPENDNEIYFLSYWITQGAEANGIPAGTVMRNDSELPLCRTSLVTLSPVQGGRYAPQAMEKEHWYRKFLSENELLITGEDICRFCLKKFKDFVSDVRVCKGLEKSGNPRTGFIRTTDIHLTPRKEIERWVPDGKEMEQVLKDHSPETYHYRVFIR